MSKYFIVEEDSSLDEGYGRAQMISQDGHDDEGNVVKAPIRRFVSHAEKQATADMWHSRRMAKIEREKQYSKPVTSGTGSVPVTPQHEVHIDGKLWKSFDSQHQANFAAGRVAARHPEKHVEVRTGFTPESNSAAKEAHTIHINGAPWKSFTDHNEATAVANRVATKYPNKKVEVRKQIVEDLDYDLLVFTEEEELEDIELLDEDRAQMISQDGHDDEGNVVKAPIRRFVSQAEKQATANAWHAHRMAKIEREKQATAAFKGAGHVVHINGRPWKGFESEHEANKVAKAVAAKYPDRKVEIHKM